MATIYQPSQWLMPKNANTDKVGNFSFDFDGVDDYIDCGQVSPFADASAFSVSGWFNQTTLDQDRFLWGTYISASNLIDCSTWNTGVMSFGLRNGGTTYGTFDYSTAVTAGVWFHCACVYDGTFTDGDPATQNAGRLKVYINGAEQTLSFTGTIPATTNATQGDFWIGSIPTLGAAYDEWLGGISEVCVFDYALTEGQITTLYGDATDGVGNPMGLDPVPIGYWKGDKAGLGDQWAVPNQVSQDYVFDFDGSSDYIEFVRPLTYGSAYTISIFAKFNGTPALKNLFNINDGVNNIGVCYWWNLGNGMIFRSGDGNVYDLSVDPDITKWHSYIFTFDGASTTKIYVDGVSRETPSGSGLGVVVVDIMTISRGLAGGYHADMSASATAVWNSVLSSGDIATVYNNGTPGDLTSLSPVSWWKLDDSATFSSNWSIPDDGSASNTGTSSGMTQANLIPATITRGTAMYSEYSFYFDGVGDHFNCGTSFNSSLELGDIFSFSAWVKFSADTTNRTILSNWDSASKGFQLLVSPTEYIRLRFQEDGSNYFTKDSSVLAVDTWHHVVATYNGSGDIDMYINGILDNYGATVAGTVTTITSADQVRIGAEGVFSQDYEGNISNVAIWYSKLSESNVEAIYNNGKPADLTLISPAPEVWWKLGNEAFWNTDVGAWYSKDQIGDYPAISTGDCDVVGEAPQSFSNGLSVSMDIDDRIGESGFSSSNALSYNMDPDSKKENVAP